MRDLRLRESVWSHLTDWVSLTVSEGSLLLLSPVNEQGARPAVMQCNLLGERRSPTYYQDMGER